MRLGRARADCGKFVSRGALVPDALSPDACLHCLNASNVVEHVCPCIFVHVFLLNTERQILLGSIKRIECKLGDLIWNVRRGIG